MRSSGSGGAEARTADGERGMSWRGQVTVPVDAAARRRFAWRRSLWWRTAVLAVAAATTGTAATAVLAAGSRVRAGGAVDGPILTALVTVLAVATVALAIAAALWTDGVLRAFEPTGRSGRARFRTVTAWGAWLVPGVQLLLPPLVLTDVVDLSGPDWNGRRPPASALRLRGVLAAWSVAHLVGHVAVLLLVLRVRGGPPAALATSTSTLLCAALGQLVGATLLALVATAVVRRLRASARHRPGRRVPPPPPLRALLTSGRVGSAAGAVLVLAAVVAVSAR
ncbi:DUF4328 domain-containing protein [Nitriliruptoraceae bacterium ZYF776]|nr:DUF4328 domain-containing protein [Profundirhabdus halotolerans]